SCSTHSRYSAGRAPPAAYHNHWIGFGRRRAIPTTLSRDRGSLPDASAAETNITEGLTRVRCRRLGPVAVGRVAHQHRPLDEELRGSGPSVPSAVSSTTLANRPVDPTVGRLL